MERTNREGFPTQQEIANFLAKYYPEESAEDKLFHDHWGLFTQNKEGVVKRVLLCTTPTSQIINFAKENKYDLVISHHDFLFNHPEVPQIIYHSTMDEAEKGHNQYFIMKMGLKNKKQYHKVLVGGDLYKPLTLEQFKQHLIRRGFEINGVVWSNPNADDQIESVLYCSGLGGYLLGPNHIIDATKYQADVYVTGELTTNPDNMRNNPFKYIIELGHTSSEKPLFKWVKNMLLNRWRNIEVDLASNEMDIWGDDNLKNKMAKQAQWDKDWEERRKEYQNNPINYDEDDDWSRGNDEGFDVGEGHPLIMDLMRSDVSMEDVQDVADFIEFYYEAKYTNEDNEESDQILEQLLARLGDIDPEIEMAVRDNLRYYFPDYGNLSEGLNLPTKQWEEIRFRCENWVNDECVIKVSRATNEIDVENVGVFQLHFYKDEDPEMLKLFEEYFDVYLDDEKTGIHGFKDKDGWTVMSGDYDRISKDPYIAVAKMIVNLY